MRLRKRETYHWCQHLIPGYQLLCFLSSPLLTALGRYSKTSQIHGPPHPPGSPRCNSRFLALTSPGWGVNPTNERSCFIPLYIYCSFKNKTRKKKNSRQQNKNLPPQATGQHGTPATTVRTQHGDHTQGCKLQEPLFVPAEYTER